MQQQNHNRNSIKNRDALYIQSTIHTYRQVIWGQGHVVFPMLLLLLGVHQLLLDAQRLAQTAKGAGRAHIATTAAQMNAGGHRQRRVVATAGVLRFRCAAARFGHGTRLEVGLQTS